MPVSIRVLVEGGAFPIRVLSTGDDAALDRSLVWVHNSDLDDPTPWLEPGHLLLTDGAQFPSDPVYDDVLAYCRRLRERDIAGLGFATDVIHASVPDEVVRACDECGVALLEVAERAPFIGIIRHVADIIAADRAARFSWLLDAQRALTRAAMRDDGLRAILTALVDLFGTWVSLYDAGGGRMLLPGVRTAPAELEQQIAAEARKLLARGTAASLMLPPPDGALLQTIGRTSHLRGVLAVGTRDRPDPAEKDLVGIVVALAGVALEQQSRLQSSLRAVRSGVVDMLLAGQHRAARRVADVSLGGFPAEPRLVMIVRDAAAAPGLVDELHLVLPDPQGAFFAEHGTDVLVLLSPGPADTFAAFVERRGLAVGTAALQSDADLPRSVDRATRAARDASAGRIRAFETLSGQGLLAALRDRGGDTFARAILLPLDGLDIEDRQRLVLSARTWLGHNGAWDPAARELGIHRHTLKARIAELERATGSDFSSFESRVDLWAALQLDEDQNGGARRSPTDPAPPS